MQLTKLKYWNTISLWDGSPSKPRVSESGSEVRQRGVSARHRQATVTARRLWTFFMLFHFTGHLGLVTLTLPTENHASEMFISMLEHWWLNAFHSWIRFKRRRWRRTTKFLEGADDEGANNANRHPRHDHNYRWFCGNYRQATRLLQDHGPQRLK